METNINDLILRIDTMEARLTLLMVEVDTLNKDAEISDENVVRVARRITNIVEHFLKNYRLTSIV